MEDDWDVLWETRHDRVRDWLIIMSDTATGKEQCVCTILLMIHNIGREWDNYQLMALVGELAKVLYLDWSNDAR